MRGSAVLVVAAGLALGGATFSLPASAGALSAAASHAEGYSSSVVKVAWWGNLGYDRDSWHSLDRSTRHDLRVQWRQARKAAKKGDDSLMTALLAQGSGGSSFTSGTGGSAFTSGTGGSGSTGTTTGSTGTTGTGLGSVGGTTGNTGGTSSLLGSLSTTTVSFTSATSAIDPTKRQAGGLPGSNYLALPFYGVKDFSGTINLSSGLMTSWLEHSTLLAGFDSNGNVTFEPLKAGAHIIGVTGGTNVKSISFGANNSISFSLIDPTQNGDFSYVLGFADGSTRTVNGNPIFVNQTKLLGQNFVNQTAPGSRSFSIPFSEIFGNFSNPNGKTLSIAGIGVTDGVSGLKIDTKNQVVTGLLQNGHDLGHLGITVTDGFTADTVTKTIKFTASPT